MRQRLLAIDVGMLMTARTQAQNAADAGALAGATAGERQHGRADKARDGPAHSARPRRVLGHYLQLREGLREPRAPMARDDNR
jgi:Flp pilus assembly protein TadG